MKVSERGHGGPSECSPEELKSPMEISVPSSAKRGASFSEAGYLTSSGIA